MHAGTFVALIESDVIDAGILLHDIEEKNVGAVRAAAGMIRTSVTPDTGISDALREMDRVHTDALLVVEDGYVRGLAERDHLVSALLLQLLEQSVE